MSILTVLGNAPLIISLPHTGTEIPDEIAASIHPRHEALSDTDWWVEKLYDFAGDLGATVVRTSISRAVIDVDRDPSGISPSSDQITTSLCPLTTFDGTLLYRAGQEPDEAEITTRVKTYFDPYHAALAKEIKRLKHHHSQIVLCDCHSIRSQVPRLFEGTLPILNIGTNDGQSCAPALQKFIESECATSGFSWTVNAPFKGGWITHHYGRPENGIHCIKVGIAQRSYMKESKTSFPFPYSQEIARPMRLFLTQYFENIISWAESHTAPS